MVEYTKEDLSESIKQIESIIKKINAIDKDHFKTSQRTLLERRLVAFEISLHLLNERLLDMKESNNPNIIEILGEKNLSNSKGFVPYKSLVFCVIDAIFSIRAQYIPTTINVLDRTAKHLGLSSRYDECGIPDFLMKFGNMTADQLASEVFGNRQRTSTTKGILKAEAVKIALERLNEIGINSLVEFNDTSKNQVAKQVWLGIAGQASGVTWRYLCMLSGNQNLFKDDTHIYNFFIKELGYPFKPNNDYEGIKKAFLVEYEKVKERFPGITIARLDHMIWKHMSGN